MKTTNWILVALALCSIACASTDGGTTQSTPPPAPAPPPPPVDPREFKASVSFDAGSTDLSSSAQGDLDAFASKLTPYPDHSVHVTGHGDVDGNEWLPEQRAKSVAAYLVSRGVAINRVTVEGGAGDTGTADVIVR